MKNVISDDVFVLIDAKSLSLNDEFMKYQPQTIMEKSTKDLITEVIKSRVKNFYRPKYDPSFADNGIQFVAGKKPAILKSYNWWKRKAKSFEPSRKSRLGTRLEYGAFLGVLIKKLVEEGKPIEWAWNAVCNNSKELGHYWDSKDAKHDFESTGSRDICGFYDLANTYKILAEDKKAGGFWLAGGYYLNIGGCGPLAGFSLYTDYFICNYAGVGWVVLRK